MGLCVFKFETTEADIVVEAKKEQRGGRIMVSAGQNAG